MELFHDQSLFSSPSPDPGSTIYFNEHVECFAVPPDADFRLIALIAEEVKQTNRWQKYLYRTKRKQPNKWGAYLAAVFAAKDAKTFRATLNECAEGVLLLKAQGLSASNQASIYRSCFFDFLNRLHSQGLLLFPFGMAVYEPNRMAEMSQATHLAKNALPPHGHDMVKKYIKLLSNSDFNDSRVSLSLSRLLLTLSPSFRSGDLTKELADRIGLICKETLIDVKQYRHNFKNLVLTFKLLLLDQKAETGSNNFDIDWFSDKYHPGAAATKKREGLNRGDGTFGWTVKIAPELGTLAAYAKRFVSDEKPKGLGRLQATAHCNSLFDYLLARPHVPREPRMFLQNEHHPCPEDLAEFCAKKTTDKFTRKKLQAIESFLEFVLDEIATIEDEDGYQTRLPGFSNLINEDILPSSGEQGTIDTSKLPLPQKFVELLEQILTEDDFAWPKAQATEWFNWFDTDKQEWCKIFSPVKTYALLTLLRLPVRHVQVRMLDSGEGDLQRYDPEQGWGKNDHPSKGTVKKKGAGVLRRGIDFDTGKETVLFYINTNKTGDIGKAPKDRGYEVPGFEKSLINIFHDLRCWQEQYNPVDHPTPYTEISDAINASEDMIKRSPDRFYLFRNPLLQENKRHLPLARHDMVVLWSNLLRELEHRLAEMGITNQDKAKSPIVLVIGGRPVYGLHSLRVTGLTALAKQGIPLEILSKVVAGHATVLMTLHYLKYSQGYLEDILHAANLQRSGQAEAELQAYLRDYSFSDSSAKRQYACNSDEALVQARNTQSGFWKIMDHGICPNGGTMCTDGWTFEDEIEGKVRKRHLPVPEAGSVGCGLCRFFLTGPRWLVGLNAKMNEIIFMVTEATEERLKFKQIKQELEYQHSQEVQEFTRHRELHMAQERFDSANKGYDVYLSIQQTLANLHAQSVELGKKWMLEGKENLPVIFQCAPNELEAHIVECSKFDLYDDICQNSEFFPSINPRLANLRRAKQLNQALDRDGKRPVLLHLDDDEQLIVANAMSRFLLHRFGRGRRNDLIEGRATLAQLGIRDQELEGSMLEALEKSLLPDLERDKSGALKLTLQEKLSLAKPIEHQRVTSHQVEDQSDDCLIDLEPAS